MCSGPQAGADLAVARIDKFLRAAYAASYSAGLRQPRPSRMRRELYHPSIQRKTASPASCRVRQIRQYSNSTLIVPTNFRPLHCGKSHRPIPAMR
jgi:hypothetical protein